MVKSFGKMQTYRCIDYKAFWEMPLETIKLFLVIAILYAKNSTVTMVKSFADIRKHIASIDYSDEQLFLELSMIGEVMERLVWAADDILPETHLNNICFVTEARYGGSVELVSSEFKKAAEEIFIKYTDDDLRLIYMLKSKDSIALYLFLTEEDNGGMASVNMSDMRLIMGCDENCSREQLNKIISSSMIELLEVGAFQSLSGNTKAGFNQNNGRDIFYTIYYKKSASCDDIRNLPNQTNGKENEEQAKAIYRNPNDKVNKK